MTLNELNSVPIKEAETLFEQCNASEQWYKQMAAARPYTNISEIKTKAEKIWAALSEKDYLQAFEAHPMIGDVNSLRKKYASTKTMASGEQSGAVAADENILLELASGNKAYLEQFGFIFIVFATGKSAGEMLDLLKVRLPNTREQEIQNAAAEQLKITLLRINKLLDAD